MPRPTASPAPEPTPDARAAFLEQVLEATNKYRSRYGLKKLELNAELGRAAQAFAERMAAEGFFDHHSPDGDSPGDRIDQTGYPWLTWGENIAMGYRTSREVVEAWIKSPGHRRNLLNPNFTQLGLGYATGNSSEYGSGCAYWVQDFAAPQPEEIPRP